MTASEAALLAFHDVSFGYYRRRPPVLWDATFHLHAGRILAVVGPNGAGKSTLLGLALGWLSPWSGQITLSGRPVRTLSRSERGRWLALVPQTEHMPFDYRAVEYVLMGRAPHLPPLAAPSGADYEIALRALEQVGLVDFADRPVTQMSGGERQLLLLARALTQQPRLLLLDEPTAHLDLHNKLRLIQIMRQLRAQGVTMLMTNHEPDVVLAVADDALLMETGRPPLFGPLDAVFTEAALSRLYHLPVRVVEVEGRKRVLWT
ncbi:MAG: ABC transporter ATP-binding protein [Anaerolineae bacterium]|nr:ABC transporter ATP-binding protein [Thermoflexales bacterium]MDW8407330.1 ABC transporter ATP-binding protein [Anaerolineae bacterium]